jgi:hypothetical protein
MARAARTALAEVMEQEDFTALLCRTAASALATAVVCPLTGARQPTEWEATDLDMDLDTDPAMDMDRDTAAATAAAMAG